MGFIPGHCVNQQNGCFYSVMVSRLLCIVGLYSVVVSRSLCQSTKRASALFVRRQTSKLNYERVVSLEGSKPGGKLAEKYSF